MRVDRSRKDAQATASEHVLGEYEEAIRQVGDGSGTIGCTMAALCCELDAEVLSLPISRQFLLQANGTARQNLQAPSQ